MKVCVGYIYIYRERERERGERERERIAVLTACRLVSTYDAPFYSHDGNMSDTLA